MDAQFYLSRLSRRLHWLVLCACIGVICGTALAVFLPPVYVAQARLVVEDEQIPGDLASSTVRTQALAQLELSLQRILSRDSLIALAKAQGLYDDNGRQAIEADQLVDDLRSRIVMTHGNGRDAVPLINISFKARSAQLAADVTNEIARLILEEDVATRARSARDTVLFFTQEVTRLDQELTVHDAQLLAFKQENAESLPDSLAFRRTQQTTGQERLLQVERQIGSLQERRAKLQSRQEMLVASGTATISVPQTAEQLQLAELTEDLAAASTLLSPENPRVQMLQAQIAGLRQRVTSQGINRDAFANPALPLTDFDIQRVEIDAELAFLVARKTRIQETLATLSASIDATNSNAITLAKLERAQANTRMQHDQAVANKARAETGKMIEALRQGQHIALFEAAIVPPKPQGPKRMAFVLAGAVIGLGAGIALVFLYETFSKGLRRSEDLIDGLGITPFATLPYVLTRAEIMRRRALVASLALVLIISVPIGFWVVTAFAPNDGRLIAATKPKPGVHILSAKKG